jgi:hypothetical protein
MLTVLLIKEVEDGLPFYLNESREYFEALQLDEFNKAYQALVDCLKPIYSGSVDHRINIHQFKITIPFVSNDEDENKLYKDYLDLHKSMNDGRIRHGIWQRKFNVVTGSEPDAVEGAQACTIGVNCFVFGGFSRTIFNQLRSFNTSTN